jgi:hypothetical protein
LEGQIFRSVQGMLRLAPYSPAAVDVISVNWLTGRSCFAREAASRELRPWVPRRCGPGNRPSGFRRPLIGRCGGCGAAAGAKARWPATGATSRSPRLRPEATASRRGLLQHVDAEDDATDEEIEVRPWKSQWPHYVRVYQAEFVAGSLASGVSRSRLLDALGSGALASTQRNGERGYGNVDPRAACRQGLLSSSRRKRTPCSRWSLSRPSLLMGGSQAATWRLSTGLVVVGVHPSRDVLRFPAQPPEYQGDSGAVSRHGYDAGTFDEELDPHPRVYNSYSREL